MWSCAFPVELQYHCVSAHAQSERMQQIQDILNEGWPSAPLPLLCIIRLRPWASANLLPLRPDGLLLLLQQPPHLLLEALAALLLLGHGQLHVAQLIQQLLGQRGQGDFQQKGGRKYLKTDTLDVKWSACTSFFSDSCWAFMSCSLDSHFLS